MKLLIFMSPGILFKKEKELVFSALKNEGGEIALRKHIFPLIEKFAEYYHTRYGVPKQELMLISYSYFQYSLKRYKERLKEMNEGRMGFYSFSSYYVWYIQQSIETYIGIAKHPLKDIKKRKVS
ncbi:MAG: hypothetical protein H0U27_04040 [Nitrosopumilus sp.]|nr:hypothetical protein [Nitrosopumilus sp.]MBA3550654.1 hypothetical protein [Patescibacteria group bacterium]MDQ3077068.1 hypothetical protein [bacterium]